jgi:hypothetical protein
LYVAGGTLSMSNVTVKSNQAVGGNGGNFSGIVPYGGSGGAGSSGGIYVGGGTVTLQAVQLLSNRAQGGAGGQGHFTPFGTSPFGWGGTGLGGGLYVGGGTVTLTDDPVTGTGETVTGNTATAGLSGDRGMWFGSPGVAVGGGIYIVSQASATVNLSSFTVTNTNTNFDYLEQVFGGAPHLLGEDDIAGSYNLI